MSSTRVDFVFYLIHLFFYFTEPVVQGCFHLSRIDPTIFYNLCALDDISSLRSRGCHQFKSLNFLVQQEERLINLIVCHDVALFDVLRQVCHDASLRVSHLLVDLLSEVV